MTFAIFSINMLVSISNAVAAENSCISYNTKEHEISISCKYANFIDIENELKIKNYCIENQIPVISMKKIGY